MSGTAPLLRRVDWLADTIARHEGGDPVGVAFTEADAYVKFDAGQFLDD